MSINLEDIKEEWTQFVWDEEKVKRFIEEESASFDPLIKKFLILINQLPFAQTAYACSGHTRKKYVTAEGDNQLFAPNLVFINLVKKFEVGKASKMTQVYIEEFYSHLKFTNREEKEKTLKIKNELLEILSHAEEKDCTVEKIKLRLLECYLKFKETETDFWNTIPIKEGNIEIYLFTFNKFTKEKLSDNELKIKNNFLKDVDNLIKEINKNPNKLAIETKKLSEDKYHIKSLSILRYKPSKINKIIDEKFNGREFIATLEECRQYKKETLIFWKKIEQIVEKRYRDYKK